MFSFLNLFEMNNSLTPCIYRGIKYSVLVKSDSLILYVTVKPCAVYYEEEPHGMDSK